MIAWRGTTLTVPVSCEMRRREMSPPLAGHLYYVQYYAVHAFAHVHTFAHSHRFGSIDTFQFTFLLKKKTIDKVTIIDKES